MAGLLIGGRCRFIARLRVRSRKFMNGPLNPLICPDRSTAITMTVFISYANEDKHVAQAACANLEATGISCCLAPRDVTPGARPHVATEAIAHCRVVVVIVSENTNRSLRVWLEVEQAVNGGLLLTPMRFQATTPARALACYLVTVHWLDELHPRST